ncbi:MAG: hypothetical protein WCF67_16320 [Chitinophagaceae bacterium]
MIPAVVISAIGLVMLLSWSTLTVSTQNTGFERRFISGVLSEYKVMETGKGVTDLAGHTGSRLYFKLTLPSKILTTDLEFNNKRIIQIDVPADTRIESRFTTIVDSPNITILAGNVPAVIQMKENSASKMYKFPEKLFIRAAMLSENSFVFRGFDPAIKTPDPIFFKGNPITGAIKKEKNISVRYNDAGISSDGLVLFDEKTNLISVVSFYSNQIMYLDTNLNLIRRSHTIDTFGISNTKAEAIASKKTITNVSPKRMVNASSCVFDGHLFVYSKIKADNEAKKTFDSNSVMDIYDIATNIYKGSFYIPTHQNGKLYKCKVANNLLICFYKKSIVSYKLPEF